MLSSTCLPLLRRLRAWLPLFAACGSLLSADAAEPAPAAFEPGRSYFGRSNYVEYLAGDLPLIISVPHGGTLAPASLPDRASGEFTSDACTEELGRTLYQVLHEQFGRYPHVIISRLERAKVDCNRDLAEGAGSQSAAQLAWHDFHSFIEAARSQVLANAGRGLYLDLHGQSHRVKRIEVGYCLTETQLTNSNERLNEPGFAQASSIRTLAARTPIPFAQLVRGSNSFGGLLAAHGYPAVPSPAMPAPAVGELYFDGGYNVRRHGSRSGGPIDGVQLEVNFAGVRDSAACRTNFALALSDVLRSYFHLYYGLELKPAGQVSPRRNEERR